MTGESEIRSNNYATRNIDNAIINNYVKIENYTKINNDTEINNEAIINMNNDQTRGRENIDSPAWVSEPRMECEIQIVAPVLSRSTDMFDQNTLHQQLLTHILSTTDRQTIRDTDT